MNETKYSDVVPNPDNGLCFFWVRDVCRNGDNCRWLHKISEGNQSELRSYPKEENPWTLVANKRSRSKKVKTKKTIIRVNKKKSE